MRQTVAFSLLLLVTSLACSLTTIPVAPTSTSTPVMQVTETFTPSPTETASATPTEPFTETPQPTETPSPFPSNTPWPTLEHIGARVTADRLSCRYGPGPEYLYLFAFRAGANIELIGRVDAENWHWVLVENRTPCWVSSDFIEMEGDMLRLPVVYPGTAKLPISPYYPPSEVLNATRNPLTHQVTVSWLEVPVSPGDYEDDSMQTYIIEVWRCEAGQVIFEPLATRATFISFLDEPGCSQPSHGQVWVQEKHGYAGPAEIPWPE